ncbi:MAG: MFS transporter [Alphaproteobacteria bacterium]|nr:MFS transporter [Alphaproteobacteria bacterium]
MAATRFFHGWIVVAAAHVVMGVIYGVTYSFAAFFADLQAAFGATRGDVSAIFSLSGFLYFALGALSGPLADRFGPRPMALVGIALIAGGLLLAAGARTLWQVYVGLGVGLGLGVGFAYVPAIACVQRWFLRRRGSASGIAVAGIGVGNPLFPPLAAWLIELGGWRAAYWQLALIAAAVGGGAAMFLAASPQARGLLPDGERAGHPNAARVVALPLPGTSLSAALRSRAFCLLYLGALANSFGLFVPMAHLAAYAGDHGIADHRAVWLVSLIGIGSTVGRFAFGPIADRLGRRRGMALMFAGMAAMQLWWLGSSVFWALGLFALAFGAFYGGFVALAPSLTADYFGPRAISGIIGVLYTSVALGTGLGPLTAGVAFDLSGSYTAPILIGVTGSVIACVCYLALKEPAPQRG